MDKAAPVNKEGSSCQAGKKVEIISVNNKLDLTLSIARVLAMELKGMKWKIRQ